MKNIFITLLSLRIASVFLVQTFFVPDEYWQSLEVAHKMVFGYGHLTWEWRDGIRNSLFPLFFAGVYKILCVLKIDSAYLLTIVPRILQAVLSTVGDFYTVCLSQKLHGNQSANWTSICLFTSWFLFYCSSRTLINSTEMAIIAIGLYHYPWSSKRFKMTSIKYLFWAALSCLLRPTAAIFWAPLYLRHLLTFPSFSLPSLFFKTLLIGLSTASILLLTDYSFYGRWLLTPLNFFHWNWTENIGAFYGQHPWHWYFLIGLPAVLSSHLLPFLYGLQKKYLRSLYLVVFYFLLTLSLVPHKEFRFLLPIFPVIFIICGDVLNGLSRHNTSCWVSGSLIFLLMVGNLPPAIYLGQWHKRAQMDVMSFLKDQVNTTPDMAVYFLMPCHNTPFYSHIHYNISMNFLSCEPKAQDRLYRLEADDFFNNPSKMSAVILKNKPQLTHLVMFEDLVPNLIESVNTFEECFRRFNSHFESKEVVVLCHVK